MYRATPLEGIGYAPSQLLMGRRLNTKLPTSKMLLQPKLPNHSLVQERLSKNQEVQKQYYDRGTKERTELTVGEGVRLHRNGSWEPGCIKNKSARPRSYRVQTASGSILERNREMLMRSNEVNTQSLGRFRDYLDTELPEIREIDSRSQIRSPVRVNINPENIRSPGLDVCTRTPESPARAVPDLHTDLNSSTAQVVTRAGRPVVKPSKYQDFEM